MEAPDASIQHGPSAATGKKAKSKKDKIKPDETSKLLAARISELEQNAAGEKDQEAEIGKSLLQVITKKRFFSCPRGITTIKPVG